MNFRALEKSIWVLEKSWKFVSEKGYEPWGSSWTRSMNRVHGGGPCFVLSLFVSGRRDQFYGFCQVSSTIFKLPSRPSDSERFRASAVKSHWPKGSRLLRSLALPEEHWRTVPLCTPQVCCSTMVSRSCHRIVRELWMDCKQPLSFRLQGAHTSKRNHQRVKELYRGLRIFKGRCRWLDNLRLSKGFCQT